MKSKIHEHLQNNRNSESKSRIQMLLLITFFTTSHLFAQTEIKAPKGYTNDIGNMISMLDNLKKRVERHVVNLDQ